MMQSYILGSDIGTGSTKTVAVDFSGTVLSSSQQFYPTLCTKPGYSEQDPNTVFNAFIKSIEQTIKKMNSQPIAVSLSSAMHGIMVVDKDCTPLTNLILWSDSRSSHIAHKIRESSQGKTIYETTGTPIHSMSPLCKIIWIREQLPGIFSKAHKFISIKEYIWYKLFHQFEIDHSLASATGLFDIENLCWNQESLALAGITADQLSQPVPTGFTRPGAEENIFPHNSVTSSIPFCIGASDGCLANLGTNSLQQGTVAITIGTSGAVRVSRSSPLKNYATMSFNYLLDDKSFICGGPINNGGSVVQWLLENFLSLKDVKQEDYDALFKAIEKVPAGSEGLIFLPYINGERAPMWDEQSCGLFFGIRSLHTQPFFLRAALEGICFALRDVLESIEDTTQPIQQINASGGFVQSAAWVQILADVTGTRIWVQQTEDASAVGAAWLCMKSLNVINDYSAMKQEAGFVVYPQKEFTEVYKNKYAIFKTLYPSLKASMHLLQNTI